MSSLFRPAVKEQLKGRVALCGPTGSGKTWSALGWATELAQGGKVAMIDTERRSASLYAPHFAFDKIDWAPPYDPAKLVDVIVGAEREGYAVLIIDSLTHFWSGEGGTLDAVDAAKNRGGGSSFDAWRLGTPLQRKMVDTILAANLHVIVTMRSKMEYVLEEYEDKGRKKSRPVKIGMAPEQRAGLEYEFTLVGDLDLEHRIVVSKSRCDILADQIIQPHRERDAAAQFRAWLDDGEPLASTDEKLRVKRAVQAIADPGTRERAAARLVQEYGPADTLKQADVEGALAFLGQVAAAAAPEPEAGTEPFALDGEGEPTLRAVQ